VHSRVTERDFPIGSGSSIVRDACQEIPGSQGSGNRSFRRQETLAARSRDSRYSDGGVVWAPTGDSGRQVSKDQVSELRGEITVVDLR
jgi:hypothetical protein